GARRSGTENTPGIAGLKQAIGEMRALPDLAQRLTEKKRRMAQLFLDAAPGALVNGPAVDEGAPHILNLSFPGVGGEVLLHALEGEGVYASTGAACSSKKRVVSAVLIAMGLAADRAGCALRFSLSPHTTDQEIEYAAGVLRRQYALLRRYGRR
ncbi:MAG: aminotransferase class V-fold PLP-dependent enzyme, partial [Clostridiales bacterium]|nr:aminotransferase class V-fold PLP-dependent enzyme [Clostridiales bacterium]